MVGRVRYIDPIANIQVSETGDGFLIRAEIPRDMVGRHLDVLTAISKGLEALLHSYMEPLYDEVPGNSPAAEDSLIVTR
jgi:hypothetical protein